LTELKIRDSINNAKFYFSIERFRTIGWLAVLKSDTGTAYCIKKEEIIKKLETLESFLSSQSQVYVGIHKAMSSLCFLFMFGS
jgi:hypothetical protein